MGEHRPKRVPIEKPVDADSPHPHWDSLLERLCSYRRWRATSLDCSLPDTAAPKKKRH